MQNHLDTSLLPAEAAATREASSIDKVLLVLLAFEKNTSWTLHELSIYLSMPKTTTHRLLTALTHYQFLLKDDSGRYHLGFRIWSMAQQQQSFQFMQVIAQPILEELVNKTQETSFLSVRSGFHSLCVARVNTPNEVQLLIKVGSASPLHLGASNSVLLAFLPEAERYQILEQTILDSTIRHQVCEEMLMIRKDGFAFSSSQLTPGAAAIGVPVFDHEQRLLAAVSIGAPAYRFARERALSMLPSLKDSAQKLQKEFVALLP